MDLFSTYIFTFFLSKNSPWTFFCLKLAPPQKFIFFQGSLSNPKEKMVEDYAKEKQLELKNTALEDAKKLTSWTHAFPLYKKALPKG